MLKKELSLLVIISVICMFSINKDDGAYAAKNKDAGSQYASSININNELPNPPGPDNNGLFLRIIRPCPNIDYKMRVLTPIPGLDPGINLSEPNKNLVVPGASEQMCERVFPTTAASIP